MKYEARLTKFRRVTFISSREYLLFRLELLITLEKPYADRYTNIT